ncbi:MAG: HAD-IIIA family hydrolase [Phycisphaerales bacterium]|nr:HAD-IIIA family hydrolase [Phycisphaerales bacterium]
MRPAVFLDRDGTIIAEEHYLADPARVRVLAGAAEGIRELREAGFACVIVSNQSAVGRGVLSLEMLGLVQDEVLRRLVAAGAGEGGVDGWYFCPEVPATNDRTVIDHPDRKPGPGMLLRAARDLHLDLASSWMIGDMLSDLLAGRNAGCRGSILVRTGYGAGVEDECRGHASYIAESLLDASRWIRSRPGLAAGGLGSVHVPGDAR